ncbi:MAG: glycoside hydrolase family 2 protein [Firmicutes bacterium]|nr:glycoside hydrolase family 2 protein [Bacillota bacterium]
MSREVLNLNTDWFFLAEDIKDVKELGFNNEKMEAVSLPHSNKLLPHHYFSEKEYQFISWYRRPFYPGKEYENKRLLVEFDGVMSAGEVFLNGQKVGEHKGGYTPFSFDITDYVELAKENLLAVRVDSTQRKDIPPEGNVVDYLLFGGIYRDARLKLVNPIYLNWAFWELKEAEQTRGIIRPSFEIINSLDKVEKVKICIRILDDRGDELVCREEEKTIEAGPQKIKTGELELKNPRLWDIKDPYLYQAVCEIFIDNCLLDKIESRIGVRNLEFREDGVCYLNNQALKLRGLNRHQMFPYLGNAMPVRGQRKDADILKNELGLNFVRSSHYPPSPAFLERCDEIGLLVFEEIPGWQHIGAQEWKGLSLQYLEEMIIRDRNHPSVFLWGVRINESPDDNDFYLATNKLAHQLDPSRPTAGVRNFRDSEFLEDVFTYNDFELNREGKIKSPHKKPYMITEYMGHMYPTKAYDSVERLIKHAVKHAQIQDKQYRVPNIAGASGWCAFDYNTHQDFGSGDRICYHGVCDIFRLPKFAAFFYRSQQEAVVNPVVFIARHLIPSFNEDYGDELIVFGNCEEVELFIGKELFAVNKPDYLTYPALPHPPFVFKGCKWWEWGASTVGSITAVGKIAGKEIARHSIYPFGQPEKLVLKPDFKEIKADGADLSRVVIELKDDKDQTLHLAHYPVFFEVEGPGRLIGENPFTLEAGRGAVFLQSKREPGKINLKGYIKDQFSTEISIMSGKLEEKIVPVSM